MNVFHDLPTGENPPENLNMIVEIPRGGMNKYEFDKKNNPFKVFKRLLLPGKYTNENNIIKKTVTLYFDVSGVDKVQVTESTYEYNNEGYPNKS